MINTTKTLECDKCKKVVETEYTGRSDTPEFIPDMELVTINISSKALDNDESMWEMKNELCWQCLTDLTKEIVEFMGMDWDRKH